MPSRARAGIRYALGLPGFLHAHPSPADCRRLIADRQARRADSLLGVFERGIYAQPRSPYLGLLRHAGVELGDVAGMLAADGVEATLTRLHESGVHLSIDEFKGRVPICRAGLELAPSAADFDNPLLRRHYEARTSGARSGSRIAIDLDLLAHESAHVSLQLDGFGLRERQFAAWRPVPPGLAGLKGMLRRARLGLPIDAWFSQQPTRGGAGLEFTLLTAGTVAVAGACGAAIPRPRHVPLERASAISRWLADRVREGSPAYLDTNWSSAVRVCAASGREGHDIGGTFFRVGGEPGTPARGAAIESVGARFAANYSMGEVGIVGVACPDREGIDDVHIATEKVAVIQPGSTTTRGSAWPLVLTTLLPSCPKLMLNVDVGDSAELRERDCGCPFGEVGLHTVASSIASHEKLTTEGMNFIGSEIAWLLEDALPARLGGSVGDYQLVEDRSGPLSTISVVVDPSVPLSSDAEVVGTMLELVAGLGDGQRLMAEQWRQAGALRTWRREPFVTGGKLQHLHVIEAGSQR